MSLKKKKQNCQAGQTRAKLSSTIYPAGKLQKQPDTLWRELLSGRAEPSRGQVKDLKVG